MDHNDIPGILADRSEGILGVLVTFSDLFDFLDLCPPGSPNRLKMMPRGIGSISTPEDFPSAIFKISFFEAILLFRPKSHFSKSQNRI